jgi:hypothetical protein
MGRSGTSAITRVLSLCGASLPKRLLGAGEGNPTGHWEPLDALNLNEAFLERYGSNWYDPRWRSWETVVDSDQKQEFIDQLAVFLEPYRDEPLLVIKEPRIAALTEFWFAAARRAGFDISAVVAVRHPDEVAASLAARDGVPIELADTLWLKYNLLAEQRSREIPRVFVEYSNLLTDWRREVDRMAKIFTVDLRSTQEQEIATFLSPDLRHQRISADPRDRPDRTRAHRVYELMSKASRDVSFSGSEMERLVADHMASGEAQMAIEQFTRDFSPPSSRQRLAPANARRSSSAG